MKKLTQNQILTVCDKLAEHIPEILEHFDIEGLEYPNRYSFPCPIHGGDSPEGCSVFTDGDSAVGNWRCWTNQCEQDYQSNIFGFIRGVLSNKDGKDVSLNATYNFCLEFLKLDDSQLETQDRQPSKEVKLLEIFERKIERKPTTISREQIQSTINIPAEYYINRGYREETLKTFDIGTCFAKNKPMSGRVVVPIYDEGYNYVGCVGRAIDDKLQPKWLHSKGFKKNILYGFNIAQNFMGDKGVLFILEGQGDVLRMYEAGFKNSVGIFGSSIGDDQLLVLEKSGVLNLIILTDYDEAGKKAASQIVKKCGRRFNYFRPQISKKDIGEMTIEQIHEELNPQLEKNNLT